MDGDFEIVVCRAIPGEHVGGPDCWCCPYVLRTEEERRRFEEEIADRPERQVD